MIECSVLHEERPLDNSVEHTHIQIRDGYEPPDAFPRQENHNFMVR